MKACFFNLRERVIAAYNAHDGTRRRIAARFSASESWVRTILRQRRDTGRSRPG